MLPILGKITLFYVILIDMEIRKIILARGIPGSGKSTWARAWVAESPETRIRINYDDLRNMMGPYWIPSREHLLDYIIWPAINAAAYNDS